MGYQNRRYLWTITNQQKQVIGNMINFLHLINYAYVYGYAIP